MTTIVSVRRGDKVALGGDGQVTLGNIVVKASARDVLEPEDGLLSIGSGGPYAQAAARALLENTDLDPEAIIAKALNIAGDICIYSNQHHTIETL